MKKISKKLITILLTTLLFIVSCGKGEKLSEEDKNFKPKVVKHDFGTTEIKKAPKRIVILDNLYAEVLLPLGITPIAATTKQATSNEFASYVANDYKKGNVISLGWQKKPDLEKIAELEPDLILMTKSQKDLYEKLSQIAPTIGYILNEPGAEVTKVWDFREPALTVADIFDKKAEMQKIIAKFDKKQEEFSKEVQKKYPTEKLMYLRITEKDLRFYGYGKQGYLYEYFKFQKPKDFPTGKERTFETINVEKLLDVNPDLLIVLADKPELFDKKVKETPIWNQINAVKNNKVIFAEYSLWQLGFGVLSQEEIIKQLKSEWF